MFKKTFVFALLLICSMFTSLAGAAVIIDSDGKKISIDQPFKRIISLYPAHSQNLAYLGLDREIVAVSRSDKHFANRATLSFRDDPERLLSLRPDLVLIRPMISRGYPQLVERLEENGVTVISLQPTNPTELYGYWLVLGDLTGKRAEAERMVADFQKNLAALKARVDAIPRDKRKNVFFEAIHPRLKTFSPQSITIFTLESAGGVNVATDAPQVRNTNIAEYGKERLMRNAREIDVFLAQKGRMNRVTVEEIRNEPGFHFIKAVRENHIYLIEEELVSRPTPHLIEGMKKIFAILYPERGH